MALLNRRRVLVAAASGFVAALAVAGVGVAAT
jgi:hypothetical protein